MPSAVALPDYWGSQGRLKRVVRAELHRQVLPISCFEITSVDSLISNQTKNTIPQTPSHERRLTTAKDTVSKKQAFFASVPDVRGIN